MSKRATWSSRSTFILAAVGSAVGLGNAWRFPGLAAKHGGGTFLLVYLAAMLILGIPLLMMEIAIGRRMRQGAPGALRGINKKFEPIGWAATSNAFVIATYYSVVFAWVLFMIVESFKFAGMTGNTEAASKLFLTEIQTTGTTSGFNTISTSVIIALLVAWGLIYYCIRNGTQSVGKVVKITVFAPVVCLAIMAAKGITMPGAMEGVAKFFVPDFSALSNATLWVDAFGQVFYSMSVMMAIMFAYGSFLDRKSNIAVDTLIIAFSDMAISVLAGIVMFSTMGGVGMLDSMTSSGVATAFIVYPQAIVLLTNNGVLNAIFGIIFYLCLVTLAIDSAFSIIEGVSTAIADKFNLPHKKCTIATCAVAAIISLIYTTSAGLACLDIVDNWANSFNLLLIGVLECIAIGWFFKPSKVLKEINKNTNKFKMPSWWFTASVRFIAPVLLSVLFVWNIVVLFQGGGVYGAADGYSLASNIVLGWAVMALVFVSGFIVKLIVNRQKKKGFVEQDITWDDCEDKDE
ncbi:MAG: sodium-dependent transporter [Clostridia bacterium]|nr:sodium-dependent transporter [Clostridia bacterium]